MDLSINLFRRHLTIAQRAEIGLLLLPEERKKTKERQRLISIEKGKAREGMKDGKFDKNKKLFLSKKIEEIKDEYGEGKATEAVGDKVKVSYRTIEKAEKIQNIAKTDKLIADQWEKAKKGETSVDAVYKKAQ